MKDIILASGSPRRKELLEKIGLKFKIEAPNYQETVALNATPQETVKFLSLGKARSVAKNHKNSIIIGADTIIVCQNKVIGKPIDLGNAKNILNTLSGKVHSVITGFTIIDTETKKTAFKSVETKVHFKKLTKKEIDSYVKTGESLDKAGAYAIQGLGSVLIEKIDGDYYNVVGLPLNALIENLKCFGVDLL